MISIQWSQYYCRTCSWKYCDKSWKRNTKVRITLIVHLHKKVWKWFDLTNGLVHNNTKPFFTTLGHYHESSSPEWTIRKKPLKSDPLDKFKRRKKLKQTRFQIYLSCYYERCFYVTYQVYTVIGVIVMASYFIQERNCGGNWCRNMYTLKGRLNLI